MKVLTLNPLLSYPNSIPCVLRACVLLSGLALSPSPAHGSDEPDNLKDVEQAYLDQLHKHIDAMKKRLKDDPDDEKARFELARSLYFIGLAEDAEATTAAAAHFDKLIKEHPDNAVYRAYRGSCTTLEGARTWAVWRKQALADEGLKVLDQAVADAPDNAEVRFIRAATTYNMPFWFERGDQSAADFDKLAKDIHKEPTRDDLLPWMAAAALTHHAEICKRKGDLDAAKQAWQAAVELAPDSPAGAAARKELDKIK